MKRDWDVIRKILIAVEDLPDRASSVKESDLEDVDAEDAYHHILIMIEAGFIEGNEGARQGGKSVYARRLTWQGHELLESIRNQSKWNALKRYAREHSIEPTLSGINAVITALRQ